MKKILVLIIFTIINLHSWSQQLTHYSNFVGNYIMVNPAVVGSAKCLEINIGHRNQWTNVPGKPVTNFLNIQGKFGQRKFNFHGIGITVENDAVGAITKTSFNLLYAYHVKVSHKHMMSFGLSAGALQYKLDYSILNPKDPIGETVIQGNIAEMKFPYLNAGLWIYNSKHFYGFSVRNFTGLKIKSLESGADTKLIPHFEGTAGRIIEITDDFTFKPAIQIKVVKGSKPDMDIQGIMDFRSKVALGIGGRSGNGISFLARLTVKQYIHIAYAYDRTLSKIKYEGKDTHEIIIGFNPCKQFTDGSRIKCAAYN